MGLSVIIPVAAKDQSWLCLLPDLIALDSQDEVIFVSPEMNSAKLLVELKDLPLKATSHWICSPSGRAKQLNLGAFHAKNKYLWFVHCDSRITSQAIHKLKLAINEAPETLFFFRLKFLSDATPLIFINQLGALFRSKILRLPFGDQGFAMSKTIFLKLNQYNESTLYGEDHLLIWAAHQNGIRLKCVNESIQTSARKYSEKGWARTTIRHLILTAKQSIPELLRLISNRSNL